MCFSLSASFTTAALLTTIGIASLRKSTPSTRMVALIPLLFAIQQTSEGFVWLAKLYPQYAWLEKPSAYFFLSFAFFVWPLWNTLALLRIEINPVRKKYIKLCLIPAAAFISYVLYQSIHNTLTVLEVNHHIVYMTPTPVSFIVLLVYCSAAVLPLLLSSYRELWVLGMLILAALIITLYRWLYAFGSIWCFFAAILSMYVYVMMEKLNEKKSTWPSFVTHFFK